jgi:RNA-directed DNA polymerase
MSLIEALWRETGLDLVSIQRIIATAPERYKVYSVPKRGGGRRIIAQPAKELKALQRALVNLYLSRLPVHPSAMAYVLGRSIRMNAATHAENGPILKLDLRNFFPSIRSSDWMAYCADHDLFDDPADRRASARILFRRERGAHVHRLSIGAPSSPLISNLLMYEFDREIAATVAKDFVTYTRYADDMTFSAKRTGFLTGVEKAVRHALATLRYPRLYLNDDKRVLATTKYRREITGLIITNDNLVSLGRDRKRLLRAQIHRFRLGELDRSASVRLAGHMAFAFDVEPAFFARMERVFGKETLAALRAVARPT